MVRFFINTRSGVPLYRQLMQQLKMGITAGILKPGEKIPTVREVALHLTINPNTVARAYREMEIEGLLKSVQGKGTFVAQRLPLPLLEGEKLFQEKARRLIEEGKQLHLSVKEMRTCFLTVLKKEGRQDHGEKDGPGG